MKPQFYIIVAVIVILFIAGVAALSNQPSKAKSKTVGLAEVTINAEIGVEQILIVNLNSGGSNAKSFMNLPYTFNCTVGNTIQIFCYTKAGHNFVAWESPQLADTFEDDNPMTIKINSDFSLTATTQIDYGGAIE